MKKRILLWCFALSFLPLWADILRPDSSSWQTVTLNDYDTIVLNAAQLYNFSQTSDTLRDVLIRFEPPRQTDTMYCSIDITGLNVQNFRLETEKGCVTHLQGSAVFSGESKVFLDEETTIDVDTLPEIFVVNVHIERGKIYSIKGGTIDIGKNKTGDIIIDHISYSHKVDLYDGYVKGAAYNDRITTYGGYWGRVYFLNSNQEDTAVVINGGEIGEIVKNGNPTVVINGGTIGYFIIGGGGHTGNIYLNGGEFHTNPGATAIQWWDPQRTDTIPTDTLFFAQHAIVGHTHHRFEFSNKDGILKLDDIHSLTGIFGGAFILVYENELGEKFQHVEPTVVNGDATYNMTAADSLLDWKILRIYDSNKRTIHYQVGDGIAPTDTTYQEGLVRYFTTMPKRTDCDFVGWYADSECTIRVDSIDEFSRGDTTLWAKWDSIPVRLGYETFGVQLSNPDSLRTRHSWQQQFPIPDAVAKQPFYTFLGWHADSLTGPIVNHTTDSPLVDMNFHMLYGEFVREVPSLSIMIVQDVCLAVRNPDGYAAFQDAYYTWVREDTLPDIYGDDSITSDTLPGHKMYIEVGSPIPPGHYTAIIQIDDGWPLFVRRNFPHEEEPEIPAPVQQNKQAILHFGPYVLVVDEEGRKYLIIE